MVLISKISVVICSHRLVDEADLLGEGGCSMLLINYASFFSQQGQPLLMQTGPGQKIMC